ncbi:hypothetical protein BDZ97DRAFT_1916734 [Flammula alnicola]|nr:hypothetical protein BDZ97DRAFT_1916734 [Flammula alnicola]
MTAVVKQTSEPQVDLGLIFATSVPTVTTGLDPVFLSEGTRFCQVQATRIFPMRASSPTVLRPVALNPKSAQLKRKRSPSEEPALGYTKDSEIAPVSKRPKFLRIIIPSSSLNSGLDTKEPSPNSLFSASDIDSLFDDTNDTHDNSIPTSLEDDTPALRIGPPIPGLFFDSSMLLPQEIADSVVAFCMKTYFVSPLDNQVMLFSRFDPSTSASNSTSTGLPRILLDLLDTLSSLLQPVIPPDTHALLFPAVPTRARQAIINLYRPGEGITPHVDLLGRYGDGIVGVSFSSGSVMRFEKVEEVTVCARSGDEDTKKRWDVYLPERSVIVLTEDARYGWTHGIEKKTRDFVSSSSDDTSGDGSWIDREVRMSVTFRWLLPGADVVGDS